MQRIYPCDLTVEQYVDGKVHELVRPEPVCAYCTRRAALHRHGTYERAVLSRAGLTHWIRIARFLCTACGHTISYLPSFALTYCLLQAATFEAFLVGDLTGRDVQTQLELLRTYRRRMEAYGAHLVRGVGYGFARAPPVVGPGSCAGLWDWLRVACGSLESATCRLVEQFKMTVFNHYQCHQSERV